MKAEDYKQLEDLIGKLHTLIIEKTGNKSITNIGIIDNYLQDGFHIGIYVNGDIHKQIIVMNLSDIEKELTI